jgi:hypothetical protein
MIELSTIYAIILPLLPTITAIIGIIASVVKMTGTSKKIVTPVLEQFEDLRQEVKDKTQAEQALVEVRMLCEQLRIEREINQRLLTELTKVKREVK